MLKLHDFCNRAAGRDYRQAAWSWDRVGAERNDGRAVPAHHPDPAHPLRGGSV